MISYTEFVQAGLVDAETCRELRHRYDVNRDGRIQLDEFLEMLCPHGYRVHQNQRRALGTDGQPMSCISAESGDECISCWIFDKDLDRFPAKMWEMVQVKF